MKKRIVAVLLSMAMVMTTGVGTVGAADFADETVAAETIDVQPEDSEVSTDDSTEETPADDASVDLDTEDGTEDPQDPVIDTQDGEDNSSVDIDFSAGEEQTADAADGCLQDQPSQDAGRYSAPSGGADIQSNGL